MAVTIALLQGVNVGKHKRISMSDFKAIITGLGGEDAATVANSGNIVFRHDDDRSPEDLRSAIEQAVSEHVAMPIPTVTRSGAEMQQILAANPYLEISDSKCLHVEFLLDSVEGALDGIEFGEDHLTLIGREIYMHLPNKMSGLTYDAKMLLKRLGTHHTSRNWNTVTKLADIAASMAGSPPEGQRYPER